MCSHETIVPTGNENEWACSGCDMLFVPALSLINEVQKNDDVIDTVTAVFAATLWDLHERAFEAHGIPHATSDATSEAVCEEKGHKMDGQGVCQRCGHSPFLGSD